MDGYLKKTGKIAENLTENDRERIIYYGLTFKQEILIIITTDNMLKDKRGIKIGVATIKF